jgi:hypothetical protein
VSLVGWKDCGRSGICMGYEEKRREGVKICLFGHGLASLTDRLKREASSMLFSFSLIHIFSFMTSSILATIHIHLKPAAQKPS